MTHERELKFDSLGQAAAWACALEAAAPKPGNVHRGADFADLSFYDFLISAHLVGQVLDSSAELGVGELVLAIVRRTRSVVRSNSNLGIALLLAPLAWAARRGNLTSDGLQRLLADCGPRDSAAIYEAIRYAQPGGLGQVPFGDVRSAASPPGLLEAMGAAADRDRIASQYVCGFADVLTTIAPELERWSERLGSTIRAILTVQIQELARYGDSLVCRKCGPQVNRELQTRAQQVAMALEQGWQTGETALADFDFWLRSDSNRRNPGTTADLIAAGLFVNLIENQFVWRE